MLWHHQWDLSPAAHANFATGIGPASNMCAHSWFRRSRKTRKMLWIMLPRFPAGAGTLETGSKRKGKRGKEEFLKRKCNQDKQMLAPIQFFVPLNQKTVGAWLTAWQESCSCRKFVDCSVLFDVWEICYLALFLTCVSPCVFESCCKTTLFCFLTTKCRFCLLLMLVHLQSKLWLFCEPTRTLHSTNDFAVITAQTNEFGNVDRNSFVLMAQSDVSTEIWCFHVSAAPLTLTKLICWPEVFVGRAEMSPSLQPVPEVNTSSETEWSKSFTEVIHQRKANKGLSHQSSNKWVWQC